MALTASSSTAGKGYSHTSSSENSPAGGLVMDRQLLVRASVSLLTWLWTLLSLLNHLANTAIISLQTSHSEPVLLHPGACQFLLSRQRTNTWCVNNCALLPFFRQVSVSYRYLYPPPFMVSQESLYPPPTFPDANICLLQDCFLLSVLTCAENRKGGWCFHEDASTDTRIILSPGRNGHLHLLFIIYLTLALEMKQSQQTRWHSVSPCVSSSRQGLQSEHRGTEVSGYS